MKKEWMLLTIMMISVLGPALADAKRPASCPIQSDTNFVYYSGSGAGSASQSWMVHFLNWWQDQDPSVSYMDLSAREVQNCTFQNYPALKMYIQPGGNAYQQQRSIGSSGKEKINDYLNNGGGYFGVCAGWYYAAPDYWWQGDYFDHTNLLGAYPKTVEGSIREIADYDENPGYAISPLDNGRNAIYYGGPTLDYEYTSGVAGNVDARHTYMNLPAVVKYNNMLLTSVHLEAFENDGITGLSIEDRIENYKYLANLINEVAETNFYVPPYAAPPQCSDGLDNDGDTYTDYPADAGCDSASDNDETNLVPTQCSDGFDNDGDLLMDYLQDPGCSSASDDDETNPTGPAELVNDEFESGLGRWRIYGDTNNDWQQRTDEVYAGSYSAGLKKTGSGKYAYLETEFNASGYGTVTFTYYRKLKGLDTADDFGAEYFDDAWRYVEHLDRKKENGGFVYKNFSIPNTATKIRFMCEAGAVSEGCWVDNVKVIGE